MRHQLTVLAAVVLAGTALDCGGGSGLLRGGASGAGGGGGGTGAGGSTTPSPDAAVDADDVPTTNGGECPGNAFRHDGGCVCQESTPTVCAIDCVDVATDPNHCGACDHACAPTSTCNGGICGPEPVTLLEPRPPTLQCGRIDLAVANGSLYWTDEAAGDVKSMNLITNVITTLASAEKAPTQVSVRGNDVYWLWLKQTLRRNRAGVQLTDPFRSPTELGGYLVSPDGASIYLSTGLEIDQLSAGGGAPVKIVSFSLDVPQERPTALALEGDQLLVAMTEFVEAITLVPGTVAVCDAFDAQNKNVSVDCLRIGQGQGSLLSDVILLVNGRPIWANGFELVMSDLKKPVFTHLASVDNLIGGMTFALGNVYVGGGDANIRNVGAIYRIPAMPNAVAVPLARGQFTPRSLATDGKRLFWSTGDCAIRALDL